MKYLKQSTAVTVVLGPFVDDTDGKTAETALTLSQADIRLSKEGAAFAQAGEATSATHMENGYYSKPLSTTDTNTLGRLKVAVAETGALPVWEDFTVLAANIYDALIGGGDVLDVSVTQWLGTAAATPTVAGVPEVDVTHFNGTAGTFAAGIPAVNAAQISGDATAADNLENAFDDTAGAVPHMGIIDQDTAQSATSTTLQLRAAASFGDDTPIGATLMAFGSTQGYWQTRRITDYVSATDTATVDAWTVTPTGTITYKLYAAPPAATALMAVNVTQIGGDAQSATDLKDFADAGYDPATNKVQGVVLVDTVTTYTGNTPQTGDAFARLGAPAGASIAADIVTLDNFIDTEVTAILAAVDTEVAAIKAVTDALPNAGALSTIQSDLDNIQTRLPVALVSGRMDSNVAAISDDATAADNLEAAFDDTPGAVSHMGIIDQGTAQSATSTTLVLRAAAAFADDQLIGAVIVITGGSAGVGQSRQVTDYVSATDTATVAAWTTTPTGTIAYKILASPPFTVDADIASILADTNDIQTRLPVALVSGRMDASVGAMAASVITAAATAADFTTEVTAGLATAAALDTIDNLLDTEVATIMSDLDDIQARLPVALVGGRIDANLGAISGDAAAADNLETAFDDTAGAVPWVGIIDQGTAQAATGTTLQLRAGAAFADDEPNGAWVQIVSASAGAGQTRRITDYVGATDTATVDAWTTTPTGTIVYKVWRAARLDANITHVINDAVQASSSKNTSWGGTP